MTAAAAAASASSNAAAIRAWLLEHTQLKGRRLHIERDLLKSTPKELINAGEEETVAFEARKKEGMCSIAPLSPTLTLFLSFQPNRSLMKCDAFDGWYSDFIRRSHNPNRRRRVRAPTPALRMSYVVLSLQMRLSYVL